MNPNFDGDVEKIRKPFRTLCELASQSPLSIFTYCASAESPSRHSPCRCWHLPGSAYCERTFGAGLVAKKVGGRHIRGGELLHLIKAYALHLIRPFFIARSLYVFLYPSLLPRIYQSFDNDAITY